MTRDAETTRQRILDAAQHLVLRQGFAGTTVDAVIAGAGVSKGAFFHHFTSKADLGRAMLERYAEADIRILSSFMARAEARSDEPGQQLLDFVGAFEEAADEMFTQPGCLFVSFVYERMPGGEEAERIIRANIELWRRTLGDKLSLALHNRAGETGVDPESVADLMFTVFEGAFILARATGDASQVRRQLGHYRRYLELLLMPAPAGRAALA